MTLDLHPQAMILSKYDFLFQTDRAPARVPCLFGGGKQTIPIRTRFKRRSFGAFRLPVLDGRRPACVRRAENHLKYHPFEVRRSFAGADLRLREAKTQSILCGWSSILTKCRRKAARQNRVRIGSVCYRRRESNLCRPRTYLFGAFCPFFFARRQPCRIKKNKNHSKISRSRVLCSFHGADLG